MQNVQEHRMTKAENDSLPVPTENLETAKSNLDESGYCLLENALDPEQVSKLRTRLVEQADAEKEKGFAYEDGGKKQNWGAFRDAQGRIRSEAFTAKSGGINQRLWMLVNKGKVFHQVLFNKGVRNIVTHILGDEYLLSSYTANIAKPGGIKMDLHTDQWWMPPPSRRNKPRLPVGSISRSDNGVDDPNPPLVAPAAAVNVLWMLVDFTPENGGTRVVPGSHLSGLNPTKDRNEDAIAAEGAAGTALIIDARIWHGTGANVSDHPRLALITTFCGPQFRPQENYTVGTSAEVHKDASPDLLSLLGFRVWNAYGRVENPAVEFISPGETSHGELRPE